MTWRRTFPTSCGAGRALPIEPASAFGMKSVAALGRREWQQGIDICQSGASATRCREFASSLRTALCLFSLKLQTALWREGMESAGILRTYRRCRWREPLAGESRRRDVVGLGQGLRRRTAQAVRWRCGGCGRRHPHPGWRRVAMGSRGPAEKAGAALTFSDSRQAVLPHASRTRGGSGFRRADRGAGSCRLLRRNPLSSNDELPADLSIALRLAPQEP
jgi:hypothetical protein